MFIDVFVTPLNESADRSRCGIEDSYFVFCNQFPKTIFSGLIRCTFVHKDCGSGRQWTIDNIAVSGNPTAIGCAPENVIVAVVEDPLKGSLDVQVVSSGRVQDAFGFPGGTAGIKNKQWSFTIELLSLAIRTGLCDRLVPPNVAPRLHVDFVATAAEHDTLFNRGALGECFIDGGF